MKPTRVVIVQLIDGRCVVDETSIENLVAAMAARGGVVNGRKPDREPFREEIRGQPTFTNFMGPMYGGEGRVRYEDAATYDRNSR